MRIFGSRRKTLAASLTLAAGLALIPLTIHAMVQFGPDRKTFKWGHPPTHVVFNSMTNNPVWGDERNFVQAKDVNADTSAYTNQVQVRNGETLKVITYFDNNSSKNKSKNTRVSVVLPTNTGTSLTATSHIYSSNAKFADTWSTMDFSDNTPFTLTYVPGSARLVTNFIDISLPDSVVNGGTLVGSKAADGKVGTCGDFSGYVTVNVTVKETVTPPTPQYACNLLNVTVGDNRKVNASVDYTAIGGATFKNVNFAWGDNTSTLTTSKSASHQYAKDGNYTINATLTFNVGGTEKTAVCSHPVSFSTTNTTTTTTTSTPSTPGTSSVTELPNTGPGSAIGLFAGASSLAGIGHYVISRRKRA